MGRPVLYEEGTIYVGGRLPKPFGKRLQRLVADRDMTMTDALRVALERWVEQGAVAVSKVETRNPRRVY